MSTIIVAARASPLSKVQVEEVYHELSQYYPDVSFKPLYMTSYGDSDRQTSLRLLDKSSDFFTRELDEALIQRKCSIAIHSAKDLPDPLRPGLVIAALTRGVDSADVLVLKPGSSLQTLPAGAVIATSSERREENVRALKSDVKFIDLRGTIAERLELLSTGAVDGVVVAEAALIRLKLTHLNRVRLPGETAAMQGKLAVVARQDAHAILKMFACIDSRQALCSTAAQAYEENSLLRS